MPGKYGLDGHAGKVVKPLQILGAGSDEISQGQFGATGKITLFGLFGENNNGRKSFKIELEDKSVRNYAFNGDTRCRKFPDPIPGF